MCRRGGERGQAAIPTDDQAAGTGWREGVFQVCARGEFSDTPARELPGEPAPQVFAKDFTRGLAESGRRVGLGLIDERDGRRLATELLYGQDHLRFGVRRDRNDAAGQRAGLVPSLQEETIGTVSERVGIWKQWKRRIARFQESWLAAGGEKTLDLFTQHRGRRRWGRLLGRGHRSQYRIQ